MKLNGLQTYQQEIENCMEEQKKVTELLTIVKILVKSKEIESMTKYQKELEESIGSTFTMRQKKLADSRNVERVIR